MQSSNCLRSPATSSRPSLVPASVYEQSLRDSNSSSISASLSSHESDTAVVDYEQKMEEYCRKQATTAEWIKRNSVNFGRAHFKGNTM